MHRFHTLLLEYSTLFFFGGILYYQIETIYRGFSHFSMIICGGFCFVIIGLLNQFSFHLSIVSQMLLGSVIITSMELITGCIVNLLLCWNVWDYSCYPYSFLGQICLSYSILWFFLSFFIIFLDDMIRYYFFEISPPVYYFFPKI